MSSEDRIREVSIEELEHLCEIAHGVLPIDVNQRNSVLERFDSALKNADVLCFYRQRASQIEKENSRERCGKPFDDGVMCTVCHRLPGHDGECQ